MLFELRSLSSNNLDNSVVGNGLFGLCGALECGQCPFIEGEINLVGSAEDDDDDDDDYWFCGDGLGDSASTDGGDGSDNIHESNTFDSILLAVTTGTGSSAYYKPDDHDHDHDHDVEKDNDVDADAENIVSKQQKFNLFMSLAGAFLYCMNYYIVEPSSTMYVNALGANDAAGATLIGMMPIASFFSAIVYSVWTNKIYRSPFLVSCCLMVSGNIVYSSAFNYKSLSMALIGRFMTGLGGPKMIVRRYIADTTCLSIRTSVNALLGMVIAAGSALGPGCAIMLSNFDFIITIPRTNTELWFNAMTGPGWFMAVMWSIFSVTLWWGFQEQERIGLKEKLQQESEITVQQQVQLVEKTIPTTSVTSSKSTKAIINDNQRTGITSSSSSLSLWSEFVRVSKHLNFPVRLCMILLFAKVFVIETLVSCTSALSKNRYGWNIHEVGLLGCANGFFVIPLSILVGKLSMSYQDRFLMVCLLSVGICGLSLLIDYTDLFVDGSTRMYNKNNFWSVGPTQYVIGYFLTYVSIQSFEGIIGSALSKLIPTALATGTFNSGLLATLVDTFGRSCGDIFISLMGLIDIRQLMNLLFIPDVLILITCLMLVRRYYDILAV
ncbi:MFS general substrate transporter [Fragilariopsis cylindrus CCMP1102]|uniref:MFS general substrate transporter n=1 Tax=Fragilariopsis cylindrus CCMP1102 TaxID=635003 RepID=A0A1E7F8W3_9STRA|nr:MFS general substrate transporter [Fragilariopsis cylindrus CCMP1102]|eukprot:OEU14455.1 MFS general substrate transporter [Fragilariopsis cylindrus CCMP1102]